MRRASASLAAVGVAALAFVVVEVEGARAPNLIVILTDDQGYADVGFNGCRDIPTPHIDSIASNGVRFTNGYVSYSVCGPSRAGLLTGRYQDRFGFTTNPTIDPTVAHAGIPLEERNIAEVLAPRGYRSMIVGKWHMGTHPRNHPLSRGFDEFYGFLSGGHDYFTETYTLNDLSEVTRKWEWYRTRLIHDRERVETQGYLTDVLSRQAVEFVGRQAKLGSPFFLYLAYNAPHTPLQATEEYLSRFAYIENEQRRTYAAMVSAVDDGVGRVLAAVEDAGVAEETIIVFLSDNGGALNNASSNLPLRGHKSTLWEGGVRVPFAMQWKGHIPAGADYDAPVISLDILATIAALSGAPVSPERPLDGVNLIPYLTGEDRGVPHDRLLWRSFHNGGLAIRQGDLKLVRPAREQETPLLFDLRGDLSETDDLGPDMKVAAASMQEAWADWEKELQPRAFPTLDDAWWENLTPSPGSSLRQALLDGLREDLKRRLGLEVEFVVRDLKVKSGWAWVHALPRSRGGESQYEDLLALLQLQEGAWKVVELPCREPENPDCLDGPEYFEGLIRRFPGVPREVLPSSP